MPASAANAVVIASSNPSTHKSRLGGSKVSYPLPKRNARRATHSASALPLRPWAQWRGAPGLAPPPRPPASRPSGHCAGPPPARRAGWPPRAAARRQRAAPPRGTACPRRAPRGRRSRSVHLDLSEIARSCAPGECRRGREAQWSEFVGGKREKVRVVLRQEAAGEMSATYSL